jgi:RimJ/RimL family protein N-acetyltransferase
MEDAIEWEATAMAKRPWRTEFFAAFVGEIRARGVPNPRVLELGSGPGFLADAITAAIPEVRYTLLDFSHNMIELARRRLGSRAARAEFIVEDFRNPDWSHGIGRFDFVVTNQAVHELRHRSRAAALHAQVRDVLMHDGVYLVCDHYIGSDGMSDTELYMTGEEQAQALQEAGFANVAIVLGKGGLVLHAARAAPSDAARGDFEFRGLREADLPMLHEWIHRPHVMEWWGSQAGCRTLEETRAKYLPRVGEESHVRPHIALLSGQPIGFIQSYVAVACGGGWWEEETDPGVRGIDQFLADGATLGQGLGTRMVSAFVRRLFEDIGVTRVQTDPSPGNARAIRCYEKAGFRAVRHVDTPAGRALLMVIDREST